MRLDDRQRAMLREMGIAFWAPLRDPGAAPQTSPPTSPSTSSSTSPSTSPAAPSASPAPEHTPVPASVSASRVVQAAPPKPLPEAAPTVAPPSAAAVGAMDWATLRETVAQCRACGLCASRQQAVFGVGSPTAHWMIVGEAPGEQEDLQGEPFVGPAGRLLDDMLRAIGLTRAPQATEGAAPLGPEQQVYITNTLKCRPPRNRNPQPDEMASCEPYLRRQIALVQPRLILALGRFAVQALLHTDEPIGRLRGRVHHADGVPVIVSYHPAYLLRNLLDKAKAWDDLCLALQTMKAQGERAAALR